MIAHELVPAATLEADAAINGSGALLREKLIACGLLKPKRRELRQPPWVDLLPCLTLAGAAREVARTTTAEDLEAADRYERFLNGETYFW